MDVRSFPEGQEVCEVWLRRNMGNMGGNGKDGMDRESSVIATVFDCPPAQIIENAGRRRHDLHCH